ncbi:hypothetical protein TeGR_g13187 [Tetraparma gracilis]|jgi:hypothetical protein|uniref:Uncharacterized protein n=1 Tax=Tetraparma gracilis TaxID=2962635 RepID=A0ABQ6MSQ8_9STRA|nr:hypothetical protein TeGR_g13187 [Tetraparma gracilis]
MPGGQAFDSYSPELKAPENFFKDSASKVHSSEEKMASLKAQSGSPSPLKSKGPTAVYTPDPKPSGRAKARKDLTDDYLTSEVQPIMNKAITHLLLVNPQDMRGALTTYFMTLSAGSTPDSKSHMISKVGGGIDPEAPKKRAALLEKANSFLTRLAHLCVEKRPDDIVKFLVSVLEKWEEMDGADDNSDAWRASQSNLLALA